MATRTLRIQRGKLGNDFWGYDILDSHLRKPVTHVGSLVAAENFAEGYALALHQEGGYDVEIRIGAEGESTRKSLLEPQLKGRDYSTGPNRDEPPHDPYTGEELEL